MEEEKLGMTAKEACRLIEWMLEHGHSEKEAIELLDFISGYKPVNEDKKTKE